MNIEQKLQEAISKHKDGKLEEAEKLYKKVIELKPDFPLVYSELGITLLDLKKFDEAETSFKKAIKLNPDYADAQYNLAILLHNLGRLNDALIHYNIAISLKPEFVEAHNNLGVLMWNLKRFNEAETNYRKTIKLKPDYVAAYNNLGLVLCKLKRFDEAEKIYKTAINIKPDYPESYNNLGILLWNFNKLDEAEVSLKKAIKLKSNYPDALLNLGNVQKNQHRLSEAEASYRQAIKLNPNYIEAQNNLKILLNENELLSKIEAAKKLNNESKASPIIKSSVKLSTSDLRLNTNPFVTHRIVEPELINTLYKIDYKGLDKTIGVFFGNGKHSSNFELFHNNFSIIKKIEKDLTDIMSEAVKSKIHISESFFNILNAGGGSVPHTHIVNFDRINGLVNQKYSLTYHISVGDQNCDEPGILKLEDPDEEILPSEGMIMIFPASRKHSAAYGGKIDRIMIGVNFYSII